MTSFGGAYVYFQPQAGYQNSRRSLRFAPTGAPEGRGRRRILPLWVPISDVFYLIKGG